MRRTLGTIALTGSLALAATGVAEAAIVSQPVRGFNAVEGDDIPRDRILVFQDDGACNQGAYTITLNWGDGNTSPGEIEFADPIITASLQDRSCIYGVEARYEFPRQGTYAVTARICRAAECVDALPGTATIANAEVKGEAASFAAVAGQQVSVPQIAEFNDDNRSAVGSDYTSVIDWGDGSTSGAPVSGVNGRFGVAGQHTYAAPGAYTVRVTLLEGGVPVAVSDAGTATVSAPVAAPAPGPVPQSAASLNVAFRPGLRLRTTRIRRVTLRRRGLPITVSLPASLRRLRVDILRSSSNRRVARRNVRVTGGTIVDGVRQVNLRVRVTRRQLRRLRAGRHALRFQVAGSPTVTREFRVVRRR